MLYIFMPSPCPVHEEFRLEHLRLHRIRVTLCGGRAEESNIGIIITHQLLQIWHDLFLDELLSPGASLSGLALLVQGEDSLVRVWQTF